jgi:hypothetical protein
MCRMCRPWQNPLPLCGDSAAGRTAKDCPAGQRLLTVQTVTLTGDADPYGLSRKDATASQPHL